ncbi:MAG: phosphoribosyltransferase [Anaerolineae bacterium]
MTKVYLTWQDVEKLIFDVYSRVRGYDYDALLAITRGGIIPGGILAGKLGIYQVLIASVDFYEDESIDLNLPVFMQFPADSLLRGKRVLVVDDLWDRGREVMTVKERVEQAGGRPITFVMHYKPHRSIYPNHAPDFYTAITEDWIIYPWEQNRSQYGV